LIFDSRDPTLTLNDVTPSSTAGGIGSHSFSLIMDGIHNLSDEVALVMLVLAYGLRAGLSGKLLRVANLFNSVGLLVICAFLIWRVVERLSQPVEVFGIVPIVAGLIGAIGNWGVARVLRKPSQEDIAIRLAYVHNLSDTLVSLIPVAAGALIITSGSFVFDSLLALLIAAVIITTTLRAVAGSHKELLWPENVSCGHPAS
jgi:cobalt-zinc-cadmium efflux system protein